MTNEHGRRRTVVAWSLAGALLVVLVMLGVGAAADGGPWDDPPSESTPPAVSDAGGSSSGSDSSAGSSTGSGALRTHSCDRPYRSDGKTWSCTFDEEFDGSQLDSSRWSELTTASSGFRNGPECYVDSPNNVSVGGGVLRVTARQEAAPFSCASPQGAFTTDYTAGSATTAKKFSQTYGRFEIRAKFPDVTTAGVHSALWLWPADEDRYGPWPASGEIDLAEYYSGTPDRAIPFLHYNPNGTDADATDNDCYIDDPSKFHTYALEWTPQKMTVSYDGQICLSDDWQPAAPLTKPAPFDHPFFLNLTQGLGIMGNAFNPATTPLPATLEVDHVRVWSGTR